MRRARLPRHDLAQEVRRTRAHRARALRGGGGTARRRRPGDGALDRRPPERAADPQARQRARARRDPAAHRRRPLLVRDRHERARHRLRSRQRAHARRAGRGRLQGHRPQGVDQLCPHGALPHRAGAHERHAGPAPRRPHAAHRRHVVAGHHGAADHQCLRRPRVQRGDVRRRVRARGHDRRRRRAGLGDGDVRARLRALGPRPLHVDLPADGRGVPRGRQRAVTGGGGRAGPPRRASGHTPADVVVDRRDAERRKVARHRGGAGQGPRNDVRAVDPRDRAPPAAAGAAHREQPERLRRIATARPAAGALLLDPGRHARDPAWHDRKGLGLR